MYVITLNSTKREEMIDITQQLQELVEQKGFKNGLLMVFVPHTTAAITINENADPLVAHDILLGLRKLVPQNNPEYRHSEGNSDAHIKASLVGSSVTIMVENGKLLLGTWQGVFFLEFDGPRLRKAYVRMA